MGESVLVALQIYGIGMVIAALIALVIKELSVVIRKFYRG
jgi:hypothetical protein